MTVTSGEWRSPRNLYYIQAAHERIVPELEFLQRHSQAGLGKALEQAGKDDLQLGPCQRLTEALVHPITGCSVVQGRTVDVECVGIVKGGRIPVRRAVMLVVVSWPPINSTSTDQSVAFFDINCHPGSLSGSNGSIRWDDQMHVHLV